MKNWIKGRKLSPLYVDNPQTDVDIEKEDGKIKLLFYNDGGKHGTTELLDDYEFTAEELLLILQKQLK